MTANAKYIERCFRENEDRMKKENDYDRERMIKEFRLQESLENRKIEQLEKINKIKKKWEESRKEIKEKLKVEMANKRKKLIRTMNNRDKLVETLKKSARESSSQAFHEKQRRQKELAEEIKQNIYLNSYNEEKEREELKKEISNKSNNLLTYE